MTRWPGVTRSFQLTNVGDDGEFSSVDGGEAAQREGCIERESTQQWNEAL
jgi:hypothetical protein